MSKRSEKGKKTLLDGPVPSKHGLCCSVHAHLKKTGFTRNCSGYFIDGVVSKEAVRNIHAIQREDVLRSNSHFISAHSDELVKHFANGSDISPNQILPELVEVLPDTIESRLFRFACLLWSVPVSQGFGRRLRFLVRDRYNGKLIGLFALGDPVFNLSARDTCIGWTSEMRLSRLVHVMDAYVVGSVQPYSQLIGGKLVAALMGSTEVKRVYERKYLGTQGIISEKVNRARLVALTTTSALGRSSLYNRLNIPNGPHFQKIGFTKGFGHFHLSGHLFEKMRLYLQSKHHPYASGHRFGMGPNWKLRVARAALEDLGFTANGILKHGVEREVYLIPLAQNWKSILLGEQKNVRSRTLSAQQIAEYCLGRWIIPRSERQEEYKSFDRQQIIDSLAIT